MLRILNTHINLINKISIIIFLLITIDLAFSGCDGFNWSNLIDINDCNNGDIEIIQLIISQSKETIEWDMDIDFNGKITPLEVGWQFWENGRLIHWICSDVPSPWYIYNYNCGLSGRIPKLISNLDKLQKLHINDNFFSGQVTNEICDLEVFNKSEYWFRIYNNKLCPPFPACIDKKNLTQDINGCYERK